MSKLTISLSPHVHGGDSIEKNMYGVLIALVPAFICSVVFFLLLLALCLILYFVAGIDLTGYLSF